MQDFFLNLAEQCTETTRVITRDEPKPLRGAQAKGLPQIVDSDVYKYFSGFPGAGEAYK